MCADFLWRLGRIPGACPIEFAGFFVRVEVHRHRSRVSAGPVRSRPTRRTAPSRLPSRSVESPRQMPAPSQASNGFSAALPRRVRSIPTTRVIPATRFVPAPHRRVSRERRRASSQLKMVMRNCLRRGFERCGNTPENGILQVRSAEQSCAWVGAVGATFPICA